MAGLGDDRAARWVLLPALAAAVLAACGGGGGEAAFAPGCRCAGSLDGTGMTIDVGCGETFCVGESRYLCRAAGAIDPAGECADPVPFDAGPDPADGGPPADPMPDDGGETIDGGEADAEQDDAAVVDPGPVDSGRPEAPPTVVEHDGVRVYVPDGALPEGEVVTVATLEVDLDEFMATWGVIPVGPVYEFRPAGARFTRPVTVVFPVAAPDAFILWSLLDPTAGFEPLAMRSTADGVAVEVSHFSIGLYARALRDGRIPAALTGYCASHAAGLEEGAPCCLGACSSDLMCLEDVGICVSRCGLEGEPCCIGYVDPPLRDGCYQPYTACREGSCMPCLPCVDGVDCRMPGFTHCDQNADCHGLCVPPP